MFVHLSLDARSLSTLVSLRMYSPSPGARQRSSSRRRDAPQVSRGSTDNSVSFVEHRATNVEPAFIPRVQRWLAPRLRRGGMVLLDNPACPHGSERSLLDRTARLRETAASYLHVFNPMGPIWGPREAAIRIAGPAPAAQFRRVARAARHVVTPYRCRQFFAHAWYADPSGHRN
jgi:hypothetical protein